MTAPVSRTEFEAALTPENVRALQMAQLGLTLGVALFAGAVVVMWVLGLAREPRSSDILPTLTLVQLGTAVAVYSVATFLFRHKLAGARGASSAQECFEQVRTAWILRLGILEGSALFGTAVTFLAVSSGALDSTPIYWVNLATPVLFVLFAAVTTPSRERLVELFQERIASPS